MKLSILYLFLLCFALLVLGASQQAPVAKNVFSPPKVIEQNQRGEYLGNIGILSKVDHAFVDSYGLLQILQDTPQEKRAGIFTWIKNFIRSKWTNIIQWIICRAFRRHNLIYGNDQRLNRRIHYTD